jgi:hypothetical protein
MKPDLLIDPVPSEQGRLGPAYIGGHGLYLVELFLIGAEGVLSIHFTEGHEDG